MWVGIKTGLFLLAAALIPQDFSKLNLIKEIEKPIDFIRVDNFGKIFLVKGEGKMPDKFENLRLSSLLLH